MCGICESAQTLYKKKKQPGHKNLQLLLTGVALAGDDGNEMVIIRLYGSMTFDDIATDEYLAIASTMTLEFIGTDIRRIY